MGHSLLLREPRPGAAGEATMPNKKKYNVNGQSTGMKAQVRACFGTIIMAFLLKNAIVSLLPLSSSSFPRCFHPVAYSWSSSAGENPNLWRVYLNFLSGVMKSRGKHVALGLFFCLEELVGLAWGSFPGKPWIRRPFLHGGVAQGGSL